MARRSFLKSKNWRNLHESVSEDGGKTHGSNTFPQIEVPARDFGANPLVYFSNVQRVKQNLLILLMAVGSL